MLYNFELSNFIRSRMRGQSLSDPLADLHQAIAPAFPGSPAIRIGVVDGLPDLSHSALDKGSIEILHAMVPPDGAIDEHGTSVCSLIFGSDPVRGLAPACSGLVLPIFFGGRREAAARPTSQLDLTRAIAFALEHDVAIINVNAGQKSWTVEPEAHLEQALQRCLENRVLTVASAMTGARVFMFRPGADPSWRSAL
jgi:hypothetical protein